MLRQGILDAVSESVSAKHAHASHSLSQNLNFIRSSISNVFSQVLLILLSNVMICSTAA